MRGSSIARPLVGLAIIAVLVGCSGTSPTRGLVSEGATPTASATADVTTSQSHAAVPSGPTAPMQWGQAVLVHGRESNCVGSVTPSSPDPNGMIELHGGITCVVLFDDPRVSGTKSVEWHGNAWGTQEAGAFVEWGSDRIENDQGTWEGAFTGAYSSETGDMITVWFAGTGAYEGLSFFEFFNFPPNTTGYEVRGLIFAGSPPPGTLLPAD